jgi:hypothetical protein
MRCDRCGATSDGAVYQRRWVHLVLAGEPVWLCSECNLRRSMDERKRQLEPRWPDPPPRIRWQSDD